MNAKLAGPDEPGIHLGRKLGFALYGAFIAVITWWMVDEVTIELLRQQTLGVSARASLVKLALVAIIATVALMISYVAQASAALVTAVGVVLGGAGGGSLGLAFLADDARLTLFRGATEPAIWALASVWLVMAVARWPRSRAFPNLVRSRWSR